MKKINQLFISLIVVMMFTAFTQPHINAQNLKEGGVFTLDKNGNFVEVNAPIIQFIGGKTHDFGKVPQSGFIQHHFRFKNIGTKPLKIQNAKAACGCTVPQWSEEPIPPQQEGSILVEFDTEEAAGYFFKDITVTTNAHERTARLFITGTVLEGEESISAEEQPKSNEKQLVSDSPVEKPVTPTVPKAMQEILYPTPKHVATTPTVADQPTFEVPSLPATVKTKKRGRNHPPVPTRPVIEENPMVTTPISSAATKTFIEETPIATTPIPNAPTKIFIDETPIATTPIPSAPTKIFIDETPIATTPIPSGPTKIFIDETPIATTPVPSAPTKIFIDENRITNPIEQQIIDVPQTIVTEVLKEKRVTRTRTRTENGVPKTTVTETIEYYNGATPPKTQTETYELIGTPSPSAVGGIQDALINSQPATTHPTPSTNTPYVEVTKLKVLMQSASPTEQPIIQKEKVIIKTPKKQAIQIISQPKVIEERP